MMTLVIGGRLGADATLGNANGTDVLNFSVAVDGWDPRAKEKITTWVRVAMFGARGPKLLDHLTKGTSVMCCGQARLAEYKGKAYLELTASEVTLMGSRPQADSQPAPKREQSRKAVRGEDEEPPF